MEVRRHRRWTSWRTARGGRSWTWTRYCRRATRPRPTWVNVPAAVVASFGPRSPWPGCCAASSNTIITSSSDNNTTVVIKITTAPSVSTTRRPWSSYTAGKRIRIPVSSSASYWTKILRFEVKKFFFFFYVAKEREEKERMFRRSVKSVKSCKSVKSIKSVKNTVDLASGRCKDRDKENIDRPVDNKLLRNAITLHRIDKIDKADKVDNFDLKKLKPLHLNMH